MPDRRIWIFTAVALIFVMLFLNRKVRLWAVLIEQIKVFQNAKSRKFLFGIAYAFWFFLGGGSYICVCKLDFIIEKELAQLLTTVFSIVFTVLFGFAAVMVSKIDSSEKTEKKLLRKLSCQLSLPIYCH